MVDLWGAAAALAHPRGEETRERLRGLSAGQRARDGVAAVDWPFRDRAPLPRVEPNLHGSTYQTHGLFPTSFVEEDSKLVADSDQRSI
jgi:hypothetical protein